MQPPIPVDWTWIAQRQATNQEADGKAGSTIWKFGFFSPDGSEVRVTFHQVGDVEKQQQDAQTKQTTDAASQMQAGLPPSADPAAFSPEGQPNSDQTENATFYVTFFSNRDPHFFMKWDSSLSHEDSLTVWVTITHGIIDFVRKAKPINIILDDLANGKLKMVLRSVAMDVVGANPEYQIEQTQKHHYRTYFQIKKGQTGSAFENSVQGKSNEGDTQPPTQASPVTGGQAQVQAQAQQQKNEDEQQGNAGGNAEQKQDDPTQPQPQEEKPAFASVQPVPIRQTASLKKGMTVEIGKDYSVAVKDKDGNAVDRYRARNPLDILRWINEKGYSANRMKVVNAEQPSGEHTLPPENPEPQQAKSMTASESYEVKGTAVLMRSKLTAQQAAQVNEVVNASSVRLVDEGVEFVFETNKNMNFKKALVELAVKKVGLVEETQAQRDTYLAGIKHYADFEKSQEHAKKAGLLRPSLDHLKALDALNDYHAKTKYKDANGKPISHDVPYYGHNKGHYQVVHPGPHASLVQKTHSGKGLPVAKPKLTTLHNAWLRRREGTVNEDFQRRSDASKHIEECYCGEWPVPRSSCPTCSKI